MRLGRVASDSGGSAQKGERVRAEQEAKRRAKTEEERVMRLEVERATEAKQRMWQEMLEVWLRPHLGRTPIAPPSCLEVKPPSLLAQGRALSRLFVCCSRVGLCSVALRGSLTECVERVHYACT